VRPTGSSRDRPGCHLGSVRRCPHGWAWPGGRARLYDLIDGRTIGQGETVLWRGDSPERSWAGGVPVYAFRCRRCGRDVPLRLPTLLAAIDADRREHPGRAGAVVEISTVQEVLE
jgi:hypothetical protein